MYIEKNRHRVQFYFYACVRRACTYSVPVTECVGEFMAPNEREINRVITLCTTKAFAGAEKYIVVHISTQHTHTHMINFI